MNKSHKTNLIETKILDEKWYKGFEKLVKTYEKDSYPFHLDACLYGEIIDFIKLTLANELSEYKEGLRRKIEDMKVEGIGPIDPFYIQNLVIDRILKELK